MEEQSGTPNQETEFNSSVATLKRIDDLMRQLHDLSRGIIPTTKFGIPIITGNPYELYISTIERLYLEGQTKFDKEETTRLEQLKIGIQEIKNKYGVNLQLKIISKGMPPHEYDNQEYYKGWNELIELNKTFEMDLVRCLDNHGMLMTSKKEGDEEPDEWDEGDKGDES